MGWFPHLDEEISYDLRWVFPQVFSVSVEDLSRWDLKDEGPWFNVHLRDNCGVPYIYVLVMHPPILLSFFA